MLASVFVLKDIYLCGVVVGVRGVLEGAHSSL